MRRREVYRCVSRPGLHGFGGCPLPSALRRRGGVEGFAEASGRVICAAGRPVAAPKPRYAAAGSALELACEVLKTRRSMLGRRAHRTSIDLPPAGDPARAPRAARTRRALP